MGGGAAASDRSAALRAASLLVTAADRQGAETRLGQLRLLVDQVMAESGVVEPHVAARALDQAAGDVARACSLVRAWAAGLPRLPRFRIGWDAIRPSRRLAPAFADAPGGQYLGASLDYAPRILDLSEGGLPPPALNGRWGPGGRPAPERLPRAADRLAAEGLLAPPALAQPVDVTREAGPRTSRGALLHLLSRAETGALTALAGTCVRAFAGRHGPTLLELRAGAAAVRVGRPGGGPVTVGEIGLTVAEVAVHGRPGRAPDPRLTTGAGATVGGLERRAIAAAVLDAACARVAAGPPGPLEPAEDARFLAAALDGQEASGRVEHLKLPRHVTFGSELERLRRRHPEQEVP